MSRIGSGIGAIAFAVLTIATFVVGNPPGGDYSHSDVTAYLSSGHQSAVFVSLYLGLLSALGLLLLVAGLSDAVEDDRLRRVFSSPAPGERFRLGFAGRQRSAASRRSRRSHSSRRSWYRCGRSSSAPGCSVLQLRAG